MIEKIRAVVSPNALIKVHEEMKNPRRNEIHADPYKGGISGVTYWGD